MFKKVSIRWRMTILSAILLTLCCISLTLFLNHSAALLVDTSVAAAITTPAYSIDLTQKQTASEELQPAYPMISLQEAKQDYQLQSILAMLCIVFGGSALTYYVAGKALQPLHVLNKQVKNISMKNLSTSLEVPSTKDEIADLSTTFNVMTTSLHEAFLRQQRFSANAAHELRTPLAVLQTKMDVFRKKQEHSVQEYEALLHVFEKQIHQLRQLVGNLLELNNPSTPLEQTSFDITRLLQEIILDLQEIADKKGISIHLNCKDSHMMQGNVELLYRAFYNLIENGINYNVNGGHIDIDVTSSTTGQLQVQIKDTGIGIPEDAKSHIFEPFYRVETSRSRRMGGAGLGLPMVQMILEKHNGTIQIEDNKPRGSIFTVQI